MMDDPGHRDVLEKAQLPMHTCTLSMHKMYVRLAMRFLDMDTDVAEGTCIDATRQALRLSHGTVDGAFHLKLHRFHDGVALVELDKRHYQKLVDATASMEDYEGRRCQLRIMQASPFLAQLAFGSRAYMRELQ